MRIRSLMAAEGVSIDNERGIGAVPNNKDVDYFGLRVLMRPSMFLRLAARMDRQPSEYVSGHVRSGGSIGAPFLSIRIPAAWDSGDLSEPARVSGHEGRNRMKAVMAAYGDDPIEVHLFLDGGMRRRHLTDEMIARINQQLIPERLNVVTFDGPYFKLV